MKEDPKIDELLNSFIDGELTAREQTEIQRLITHDAKIAQRVRQLQKCKMLVSSLPVAEAPDEILEDIKASLERITLLGEQPSDFDERAGARHLLVRKVLAATAMIGLVTVLAAVVYTIVTPETEYRLQTPDSRLQTSDHLGLGSSVLGLFEMEFGGKLELKTSALVAVDAFINKAIQDLRLKTQDPSGLKSEVWGLEYSLSCSREDLNLLLADLGSIWEKFDSATLSVETEAFGKQVVVEAVTAEQIAEIVNQDSLQRRTEVARDFALLNDTAERLPGREIIAAIDTQSSKLKTQISKLRIPKPGLTWRQKTKKTQNSKLKTQSRAARLGGHGEPAATVRQHGEKVHLVIVVAE